MENKDPFREFIESLDSINHLSTIDQDYVDQLVNRYGLPQDEEAKQILVSVIKLGKEINARYVPVMWKHYLLILLWDITLKNTKPISGLWDAFTLGIAFGELFEADGDSKAGGQ